MNEYRKELKRDRSHQDGGKDRCPLCGADVTYRGFTNLECAGIGCVNWNGCFPVPDKTAEDDLDLNNLSWFPPWLIP